MAWISYVEPFFQISDLQVVALTAYAENRGGGAVGMQSVINVIQNRTLYDVSEGYADPTILAQTGSKYYAVCLMYEQFSSFNLGNSQRSILLRLATPAAFNAELQNNLSLRAAWELCQQLEAGTLLDITGGANHYFAAGIQIPVWASSMVYRTTIAGQLFYSASPFLSQSPQLYVAPANANSTIEIAPTSNPISVFTPASSSASTANPEALAIVIPTTIIKTLPLL
jgi:hypothetical protein